MNIIGKITTTEIVIRIEVGVCLVARLAAAAIAFPEEDFTTVASELA